MEENESTNASVQIEILDKYLTSLDSIQKKI